MPNVIKKPAASGPAKIVTPRRLAANVLQKPVSRRELISKSSVNAGKNKDVSYDDIRKRVVPAVLEKYGMIASEFADSRAAKKLGLKTGNSLKSFMAGSSVSFPTMKILADDVGIKITYKLIVTRKATYTMD